MTENPRVTRAVELELEKLARSARNIATAVDDGRISQHDGEERTARAEQWATNRIAFLRGDPRPQQRKLQQLDDPDAGRVG
jgi:hypothetical protein